MNLIGLDAFQLAVAATPIGKIAAGTKTIWGRIVVEALEMAAAGATEGGEEVYQSYISKKALGEEFDIFGTRHGFGYGWFDRFLSQVPKQWLRVGITDSEKFYSKKLLRQPWDEQIDWILSYNQTTFSWEVYETLARHK
jgi:hypothetical protein